MIYLAYDGTIHGDWVSHYAIRLAAHQPDRALCAVHVDDGLVPRAVLEERLHLLEERCRMALVALQTEVHALGSGVWETLRGAVPPGPSGYLVCGTRLNPRRRGFLSGTVGERLLQERARPVLAVRVVQPGLLGAPHSLLVPVAGVPGGLGSALPWLALLAPDVRALHFLYVEELGRRRFRRLGYDEAQALRRAGSAYLHRVEGEARRALALPEVYVDAHVVVSDDVPKEIVIQANRLKSELICLGASARNRSQRFVYGDPIEQVLANAPCDVAVYEGAAGA
jgi:nucleotide-binding universal stress UspA family protein